MVKQDVLLGMGNPLLDISAVVKSEMLAKYNLKADDAILYEKEDLFEELLKDYQVRASLILSHCVTRTINRNWLTSNSNRDVIERCNKGFLCIQVDYIAGGATQNAIRVAQWIIPEKHRAAFFGCVGDDQSRKTLEECAKKAGVTVKYQYHKVNRYLND